jgi:hypothetical protein
MSIGDAAVEDADGSNRSPRAAPITATTTSRPTTMILGIRRGVVRAVLL